MGKFEDIDIINYIVNNGATAKETAEHFNVSLSTIRKRLATIKSNLTQDSPLYKELMLVITNNQLLGRQKGGLSTNSGIKIAETIESIASKAMTILSNNMTLEEASITFSMPTSTLSEHLKLLNRSEYMEIYNDLLSMFEYHKRNKHSDVALFKICDKYSNILHNSKSTKK